MPQSFRPEVAVLWIVFCILGLALLVRSCPAGPKYQQITIAARTDGLPGTGTAADPFDGSTAEKFDAILRGYAKANTTNLEVILSGSLFLTGGCGTYGTWGGPVNRASTGGWGYCDNWYIHGLGENITTLRAVDSGIPNTHVIAAWIDKTKFDNGSDPGSVIKQGGLHVSDLTIDCNLQAQTSGTFGMGCNAEAIVGTGSRIKIENVHLINWGSTIVGAECFVIFIVPRSNLDGKNRQTETDCEIAHVRIDTPAPCLLKDGITTICIASLPENKTETSGTSAGWIHHVRLHDNVIGGVTTGKGPGQPTYFHASGLGYSCDCDEWGNYFYDIHGAGCCFYGEGTAVLGPNTRIHDNRMVNVWSGIFWNGSSSAGDGNGLEIRNNTIALDDGAGAVGIGLVSTSLSNALLTHNTIYIYAGPGTDQTTLGIKLCTVSNVEISKNRVDVPVLKRSISISGTTGLVRSTRNATTGSTKIVCTNNAGGFTEIK
jgi:hypothetical protein